MLFETHKDRVYSLALYYTGDEASARDITQDVFLKLFTAIRQFRGDASFTTWLYRIVLNACMDEHRRRRRLFWFGQASRRREMTQTGPQEGRYLRRQIAESVQSALRQLKPGLRIAVLLRYIEGLSYQEIARVLGCSTGTVASRLNRGHKILARKLAHLRDAFGAGF